MKKKSVFSISMCIVLVLCMVLMSTTAFAATDAQEPDISKFSVYGIGIPNSGEPGTIGMTRALGDCKNGPHDMLSRGWGDIIDVDTGEYVVYWGACWQCTQCYLVLVTQGQKGEPLGYYTSWQPYEEVGVLSTTIFQSRNNIFYTTSTTIPGVNLRYAGYR